MLANAKRKKERNAMLKYELKFPIITVFKNFWILNF